MGFAALLIHQMRGMIEMHFGIFVLLAFLLFYRDWLCLVVAAAVIAVHYLGFYLLQCQGVPVYVFPHTGVDVATISECGQFFATTPPN
jgi:methyl-accepting chemotaxis protein